MDKESLSKLSKEELLQKYTVTKTIVWLLAIVLICSLIFFIYISIRDGLTPLVAVPIALFATMPQNIKNMNTLKKEIDSRK
ncbi:MAG: redox-active disulfide protein 2 [Maribacter sp.]